MVAFCSELNLLTSLFVDHSVFEWILLLFFTFKDLSQLIYNHKLIGSNEETEQLKNDLSD